MNRREELEIEINKYLRRCPNHDELVVSRNAWSFLLTAIIAWADKWGQCNHKVVPCSRIHPEGERVMICNTELTERMEAKRPAVSVTREQLEQVIDKHVPCAHYREPKFIDDLLALLNQEVPKEVCQTCGQELKHK